MQPHATIITVSAKDGGEWVTINGREYFIVGTVVLSL
jgi:hypothetical protein